MTLGDALSLQPNRNLKFFVWLVTNNIIVHMGIVDTPFCIALTRFCAFVDSRQMGGIMKGKKCGSPPVQPLPTEMRKTMTSTVFRTIRELNGNCSMSFCFIEIRDTAAVV